ncbi:MAG: M24 family metallopeptidase [Candidatus Heimdallarchaeota archaeon]
MIQDLDNELSKERINALVVLGDSTFGNPSLTYVVGATIPRGGIYIKPVGSDPMLIVSEGDIGSAKQGVVKDIRSISEFGFYKHAKMHGRNKALIEICVHALKELHVKGNIYIAGKVEAGVALSWAEWLKSRGFSILINERIVNRVRITKNNVEIEKIRSIGKKTENIVGTTIKMLLECDVDREDNLRVEGGKPLTVGDVKAFIRMKLAEENLIAPMDTVFAIGAEGADPHNVGSEKTVIAANTPIVFDIFPQEIGGYWFDTTRTFVIGKAAEKVKKSYVTVLESQQLALDIIQSGVPGKDVMMKVCEFLEAKGYKTPIYYTKKNLPMTEGLIHGLGHGIGLTIGEPPNLGLTSEEILKEGAVTTVEPGLYYPNEFGVRVEDVVVVRKNKIENLSTLPKELEI